MTDSKALTGGCECGRIRYTTRGLPFSVAWCYCKQCQRLSGAPFIPFGDLMRTDIVWTQQPDVYKSSKAAERDYCKECGSTLGMRYLFQPDRVSVALGTVDKEYDVQHPPDHHIFLKDKPSWFSVPDDGSPRYQLFPDYEGFQKQVEQYASSAG